MSRANKNKLRRIISLALIAVGVFLIGSYAYNTIHDNAMLADGDDFYQEFAEQVSALPSGTPIPAQTPDVQITSNATETDKTDNGAVDVSTDDSPEPESSEESVYVAPRFDFSTLRDGLYPDLVGWIQCTGTKIDYPVVQGNDNDYYLDHLPDGTQNIMGSIYIDFRNSTDLSDKHTVIYGHHIKNGVMFGSLDSYKSQSYYNAHPTIELYTQDGDYIIQLFAGYVVDAETETIPLNFKSAEVFMQYVEDMRARSTFSGSVEVNEGDRLVSLVTCTYDFNNARYILIGKLVSN